MVYLDNAATTKTDKMVLEVMLPYLDENFGNPSGLYEIAVRSRRAINGARDEIAKGLNCDKQELYFTSGGTEADNWAIKAAMKANSHKGKHMITSKIEHHAILNTCKNMEKSGYQVTYVNVDESGIIKLDELIKAIRHDTVLISVMYANNEIGTIQPIKEIAEIAKENGILFHTDAVQAFGHIPIDVKELKIDLLSASGHKLNGPKGIGFLYAKSGINLEPYIHGGGQENGMRSGTENVAGIVGLGMAAKIAHKDMERNIEYETTLREYCMERILKEIPYARINGNRHQRLPNNMNFSFQFIEGQSLLILLDMKGICAATGSACSSASDDPSHVLMASGLPKEIARGSLRLTLGTDTTKEELDYTIEVLKESITKLRSVSEVYEDFMRKNQGKR